MPRLGGSTQLTVGAHRPPVHPDACGPWCHDVVVLSSLIDQEFVAGVRELSKITQREISSMSFAVLKRDSGVSASWGRDIPADGIWELVSRGDLTFGWELG